jgi:hypothetical protein
MKTSWFIGMVMLFMVLSVIANICEMNYLGAGEVSTMQKLMQPDIPAYSNPVGAVVAYITVAWDYIKELWAIFWFDYPFFTGSMQLVRMAIFMPVSIGIIISIVLAAIRGVGSS